MKLRKPYKHTLEEILFQTLFKTLKDLEDPSGDKLQCYLVDRKPITYGWKAKLWMLGHSDEMTPNDWGGLTTFMQGVILGIIPDAEFYIEPWTADRKFQFRWETYIQTREP